MSNRFFGKYRGAVVDVDAVTMRVKARVPAVLGQHISEWAQPCVPFAGPGAGFVFLPAVGTGVWIEFEGGDVSYPIWSGCYWLEGEQPPDGSVLAIVTTAGQKILLNVGGGTITVSDQYGNAITLAAGGLTLQGGGQTVAFGGTGVSVNNRPLAVA
ncbi:MAG TPA: phage baseplate assembly protein V [Xanthobacteraceae bacterium]|nr:phage baseplate assembly protein V [Xanthobacteraceae bacterium]